MGALRKKYLRYLSEHRQWPRCWFADVPLRMRRDGEPTQRRGHPTNVPAALRPALIYQQPTLEHLYPQSAYNFMKDDEEMLRRNIVFASYLCNTLIGTAPLCLKFDFRAKVRAHMAGREDFTLADIAAIKQFAADLMAPYVIANRPVWRTGFLRGRIKLGLREAHFWSQANTEGPYAQLSVADLDRRHRVMRELHERDVPYFKELFGIELETA